ncbi:MAG: DNA lyase [Armatimonadetes bacterium JP3_11]|nr:MAG: DNA lyase [Armatimonadetes bacterium CP1_7O]OYT75500.1 MAG: DNA lyase [Armatimonadetes bacterium JP3_11]RMH05694.1 MAG: endonuclease III [Armatimonadota bacterium]
MAFPIAEIVARLEARYGIPEWKPRNNPLEELIHCILSQHTSDANSFRAYRRLREQYPTWQAVVDAPTDALAATIRSGGLANQKAPRIQAVLRAIREAHGDYSLDWLRQLPTPEARKFLLGLPGIGPKCAAIVLCFAMGRPVIPVDTHVFRVSWRLGLIPKSLGEAKAHDALEAIIPEPLVYRFHVALIQHGRAVCKAQNPRCAECPLQELCAYYQANSANTRDSN